MASYHYKATWKDGEKDAVEISVADDVFSLGPSHLALLIKSNIATRSTPRRQLDDIKVEIGPQVL